MECGSTAACEVLLSPSSKKPQPAHAIQSPSRDAGADIHTNSPQNPDVHRNTPELSGPPSTASSAEGPSYLNQSPLLPVLGSLGTVQFIMHFRELVLQVPNLCLMLFSFHLHLEQPGRKKFVRNISQRPS